MSQYDSINTLKSKILVEKIMDLNEILTKERDSLRDENIELSNKVKELELKIKELEKKE
jgi:hypothetical protein